jgi:hypothetical protein
MDNIEDVERMRVCKRCNRCTLLIGVFNAVKRVNGKTYYSHICKPCTLDTRKEYMKAYHEAHYVSRKKNGNPPPAPDELMEYPPE